MFIIVVYDITDNKRRTKMFKAMKNFGTPIQFSAFECILNEKGFQEIQEVIRKIISRDKDKVRLYLLCNNCRNTITNVGTGQVTKERPVIIV